MDYSERGFHARGVYRMGTPRVEQEEEADTIIIESNKKSGRKESGRAKRKSPKQGLTSAKDLTIKLPEERDSPLS